MSRKLFGWQWAVPALAVISFLWAPSVQAQSSSSSPQGAKPGPVRFTAIAANLTSSRGPMTRLLDITIDRWSTDAERSRLTEALKASGQQGLLKALQQLPAIGYIRTPNSLGYELRYARLDTLTGGGQRILVLTDRYVSFAELTNQSRSLDYPFTLIEMRLKPDGEGTGQMSVAASITQADNLLIVDNYAIQPIQLTSVRREK
jgi:hypothetical protein